MTKTRVRWIAVSAIVLAASPFAYAALADEAPAEQPGHTADQPIPVEPDGGIGDTPIPVEPDGGIGSS